MRENPKISRTREKLRLGWNVKNIAHNKFIQGDYVSAQLYPEGLRHVKSNDDWRVLKMRRVAILDGNVYGHRKVSLKKAPQAIRSTGDWSLFGSII